ncbi:MAG: hypothetical protein CSB55_03490 [Candidatus Cloacimonadota bacterium]|nr:MAG: hypothetical protein CSB55_03490 [Candidatus Cloacimonadota bacterium]
MKILLYGNTANNHYIVTKVLRRNGFDADFIIDKEDYSFLSQPVWQDADLTIEYADFYHADAEIIKEFNNNKAWNKPDFVKEASGFGSGFGRSGYFFMKIFYLTYIFLFRHFSYLKVLNEMKKYDLIIVNGIFTLLTAFLSGKKYIIYPYGKDLRIALGVEKFSGTGFFESVYNFFCVKFCGIALKNCCLVLNGDAGLVTSVKNFDKNKYVNINFPIPLPDDTDIDIKSIENILNISFDFDKTIVFIPSRVDYKIKGHNHVIEAIKELPDDKFQFFFSGWGTDLEDAKMRLSVRKDVFFLGKVLSKSLLMKFFRISDLVIDQLIWGTYGTSAMEAMACKKSVVIHINREYYLMRNKPLPDYYYEASDKKELLRILCDNTVEDFRNTGEKAYEWILENHSEEKFIEDISKYLN